MDGIVQFTRDLSRCTQVLHVKANAVFGNSDVASAQVFAAKKRNGKRTERFTILAHLKQI